MSNEAETIADLARKAQGEPQVVTTPSGREFLILPSGHASTDVTPAHKQEVILPKSVKQSVTLQNADALIAYLKRFKRDSSILFADVAESRIVGMLDYHTKDQAELVEHRATLALPFSEEWKVWSAINGQLKPQLEFARFVEENAPDIKAPDAGSLLEAVRDLQARRSVNFIQAVRTASDNESFEFNDNTEARTKGDLELPTKFMLSIPVYFGDPDVEVPAFLRWKLDDGKLLLGIKLHVAELADIAMRHRVSVGPRPNHLTLVSELVDMLQGREVVTAVCRALRARDAFCEGTDAPILISEAA